MPRPEIRNVGNGEFGENHPTILRLEEQLEQTLNTFSVEVRSEKNALIFDAFNKLSTRLKQQEGFVFGKKEQAVLKLKLARYFQREDSIDINTLCDALVETPGFINSDKGGLHRLLEIHEQKTLQKIAEIRKQRAEIEGDKYFNPYEALFTTSSGKFYLARLLNMPHLEEESEYMKHCVGTSSSYINKIKQGEVDIFSLRTVPTFNNKTNHLEGDSPVLTIEYDPKNKIVLQVKKAKDELVTNDDLTDLDFLDVIKQLGEIHTNTDIQGRPVSISPSELADVNVREYYVLTDEGEIYYSKFDSDKKQPVLKTGDMRLEGLTKRSVAKIVEIFTGVKFNPDEIAQKEEDVSEKTKVYIGKLYRDFFLKIPDSMQYVYTSWPKERIEFYRKNVGGKTIEQMLDELVKKGYKLSSDNTAFIKQDSMPIRNVVEGIIFVHVTPEALGFPVTGTGKCSADIETIYKKASDVGLKLCSVEEALSFNISNPIQTSNDKYLYIALEDIPDIRNSESLRFCTWYIDGYKNSSFSSAVPRCSFRAGQQFVFCKPK